MSIKLNFLLLKSHNYNYITMFVYFNKNFKFIRVIFIFNSYIDIIVKNIINYYMSIITYYYML
ncbi:hypothetical protein GCM10008908_15580 [Clostridium subterminale]|uniref:Uncharacterized protein n=1 Tax=Clostridium subterminale TaxID=1550 RepID=A0ABP3VY58_CLOSU